MKAKRRRHDPEFKARVALEALKGVKTIQQIAKDYEVHPVQVSEWKKIMAEGASGVFGPGSGKTEASVGSVLQNYNYRFDSARCGMEGSLWRGS